jgi:diacylglycerol kinase
LIDNRTTPATFPNVYTTISEVGNVPMEEILRRVISNTMFGWTGLIAFFGLAAFRWRVLLPLVPMLALGLLSFKSSNRFIMYLAPFIGIGLGWLLSLGIESLFYFWPRKHPEGARKKGLAAKGAKGEKGVGSLWDSFFNLATEDTVNKESKEVAVKDSKGANGKEGVWGSGQWLWLHEGWMDWVRQGTLYLGMGVFFWGISEQTAISFVPGPSIQTRLYTTFLEVKKRVSEDSALLTWWDYGYAITDATGLATFHNGGSQATPKTYFTARGLISSNPEELYDITQYLATESNLGIAKNNTSPEALLQAVRNPTQKPWDPIYLFFTADMTGKYGAISKLGSWDIVNGGSQPRGYQNLACNKITNVEMICRGAKIDLKAGRINNQVALKRMVFIRDGKILREQEFGHDQGHTLQLLVAGQRIVEVQLIDEVVFRSNYNQMFLLGRYRDDLYEETYNAFPFSRLYRVKF